MLVEDKASSEQTVWEVERKEREYLKKLNTPVDKQIEFMKSSGLIVDDVVEDEKID
jgi:hypothetical protein